MKKEELFNAVHQNDISVLQQYRDEDLESIVGLGNYSLLHEAAHYSNEETILFLLKRWKDVNVIDDFGNTPLIEAINNKNLPAVKRLVEYKADLSIKNSESNTALWYACAGENKTVVNLLLQHGADANERYVTGETPIIITAQYNSSPDIIKTLLDAQADPNAQDAGGFNALIHAVNKINIQAVELLVNAGAKTNFVLEDGRDLLFFVNKIDDPSIKTKMQFILDK